MRGNIVVAAILIILLYSCLTIPLPDKIPKEIKGAQVEKFIILEKNFREIYEKTNFLFSVGASQYLEEKGIQYAQYWSSSGFAVRERDTTLFLTAAHAILNFSPTGRTVFFFPQNPYKVYFTQKNKITEYSSGMLDITAYPEDQILKLVGIEPTVLGDAETLKRGQPLALFCNPFKFFEPVRVGFLEKIDRGVGYEYLIINFAGLSTVNYCSGGPIVGKDKKAYGMLVRGEGLKGYAVTANVLKEFIDKKFNPAK
jgi:hypothetical protein